MVTPYRVTILRVFGIPIKLDISWVVIALVVTWSLKIQFEGVLGGDQGLTHRALWLMGAVTSFLLFVCLVLHELGHSVVAQRYGIKIRSITLFIFGGVAELESEPPSPRAELAIAIAGPAVSLALAGAFWVLALLGTHMTWHGAVTAVCGRLAFINGLLVGFNLIPAFPLDGGRVARALWWAKTGNLKRATSITAQMGMGFGSALIFLGVLLIIQNAILPGMWWVMLGWFLRNASQSGYQHVLVRDALKGESVRRFMTSAVSSVPPDLAVDELVERFMYSQHHKLYPVQGNGELLGYVTPAQIKTIPRADWSQHRVSDIMDQDCDTIQIPSGTDALDALARMQQASQSRLLVVDEGRLVGIVTLRDLLSFLTMKIELGAP